VIIDESKKFTYSIYRTELKPLEKKMDFFSKKGLTLFSPLGTDRSIIRNFVGFLDKNK